MLNIRATHGVPLCLSGTLHPLPLSHEMADHDRRRQAMMRRQRSLFIEGIHHANQEMGSQINFVRDFLVVKGEDLDDILHDLFQINMGLTARAA
ncbi:uncharacterized protein LOC133299514 [Gastrolobium bilobum]|uniref:uncharacterized protein LOC133299514 n=1 Tax=Gastrolobium bilobum TaxID=150636 RepID=UPI002AB10B0A|nr:uncharacterized protein LOC133299514 [Gastrolobium bilobum]